MSIINGMPDHIHCLFLLNTKKSIAFVIKQIKGSTSHFANQDNLMNEKFAWQTGYASFYVSEFVLEKVFICIKNQKYRLINRFIETFIFKIIKFTTLDSCPNKL